MTKRQTGRKVDHLPSLAGLPDWMHDRIRTADRLFMQARAAALEGNHATADRLRNEADLIYNELEAALQAPAIAENMRIANMGR